MFGLGFFLQSLPYGTLQYALTASQACIILMSACFLYPQLQETKYGKVYPANAKLSEDLLIQLSVGSILGSPHGLLFSVLCQWETVCLDAGALEECGILPDIVQILAGERAGAAIEGMAQCLVCFEDVHSLKLTVQLPCGHCTCNTCWQVSHLCSLLRALIKVNVKIRGPKRAFPCMK